MMTANKASAKGLKSKEAGLAAQSTTGWFLTGWLQMRLPWQLACRLGAPGGAAILLACTGLYLFRSRNWPLVNDAALMHYVVFLMQHGFAPYREIGDINLPGAYAPEWVSMMLAARLHLPLAPMWRVMDASSLLLAGVAMLRITRPYSWFAGICAGCLFALYHGRDGIGQAGQRDLWVTLLLLWAVASLFQALRSSRLQQQGWAVFCFGLFAGAATTIKPFGMGFSLLLLPLLLQPQRVRAFLLAWAGAGFMLPLLAAWLFLLHWHAVAAIWHVLRIELPYHASLADGAAWQLVGASSIRSLWELLCLFVLAGLLAGGWRESWAALRVRPRLPSNEQPHAFSSHGSSGNLPQGKAWVTCPERLLLVFCVLLGLLFFVVQGKGYPYQRYPYVAFSFLLVSLEFAAAAQSRRRLLRIVGIAGLAFAVLLCAPSYLRVAAKARWSTPVTQAMENAIAAQAGLGGLGSLDGEVQCMDVVSGCTDALLHLCLREATGTIYDEFLFPQTPSPWGNVYRGPAPDMPVSAAVIAGRQRFQAALLAHAPRVIVITAWLFPEGPGAYRKLLLWPWLNMFLAERYTIVTQQDFAPAQNGPMGFRIYVRRALPFEQQSVLTGEHVPADAFR